MSETPVAVMHMNDKGRTVIPAAIRAAAFIGTNDELVARVAGPGIVVLESRDAIRARIRANAGPSGGDMVARLRADRVAEFEIESRKPRKPERSAEESAAIGEAMLAELGL